MCSMVMVANGVVTRVDTIALQKCPDFGDFELFKSQGTYRYYRTARTGTGTGTGTYSVPVADRKLATVAAARATCATAVGSS